MIEFTDYDPDEILHDPGETTCPVCGGLMILDDGEWICPECNEMDPDE